MSLAVYVCLLGKPFWQESKNELYVGLQEVTYSRRKGDQPQLVLQSAAESLKFSNVSPESLRVSLRCCSSKRGFDPSCSLKVCLEDTR